MDVIRKRYIFLGFSGTLVLISWILIITLGLRQGIDLKGGTQWQLSFTSQSQDEAEIHSFLKERYERFSPSVKQASDGSYLIRLKEVNEEEHQGILRALKEKFGEIEEKNFSSIGPTIGKELRRRATIAIVLVLLGISLYVAWAFRKVSEPIRSWKYGVVTLVTLFHDVSIPTGLLAFLGRSQGVEIDTNFIVALLVVMGFSVHDTIVVFDRVRENLLRNRGRKVEIKETINASVKETFARSVNTSLTLIFVLVALLAFGPPPLFYFVLTILVGTVFGTYSSIFVASPLLYLWRGQR